MNLNLLYSLGRPVEESDKLLNKYTFLAYKYNYPYRIFNNRNLWSYYKKNGNNMDISISIQKFLEENEEVLFIPNIINNTTNYECVYDGNEHSIKIDLNIDNYDIKYSINNKNYDLVELPKFKDVGEYTINYIVTSGDYIKIEFSKEAYIKESKKLRYNGISVRKIIHVDNVKDIGDILEMEKNGFSDNEITYYKNNDLNQIIFQKKAKIIYIIYIEYRFCILHYIYIKI